MRFLLVSSLVSLSLCACAPQTDPRGEQSDGGSGAARETELVPKAVEECIAPCLYEMNTRCAPVASCVEDRRSENPLHVVLCEVETGWRQEIDDRGEPYKIWATWDGEFCSGLDPAENSYEYYDRDGLVGSWWIGEPKPGGGVGRCAGDEAEYPHDSVSPECAEFFGFGFECVPGVCPD